MGKGKEKNDTSRTSAQADEVPGARWIQYAQVFTLPFWDMAFSTIFLDVRRFAVSDMNWVMNVDVACNSVLEIPTGMFGDRYGPKVSVLCGMVFCMVGKAAVGLVDSWAAAVGGMMVKAVGGALISGSVDALLRRNCEHGATDSANADKRFERERAGIAKYQSLWYIVGAVTVSYLGIVSDITQWVTLLNVVQIVTYIAALGCFLQVPDFLTSREKDAAAVVSWKDQFKGLRVPKQVQFHLIELGLWTEALYSFKAHVVPALPQRGLPVAVAWIAISVGQLLGGSVGNSKTGLETFTRIIPCYSSTFFLMPFWMACMVMICVWKSATSLLIASVLFGFIQCLVVVNLTTRITSAVDRSMTNTILNIAEIIATASWLAASVFMNAFVDDHGYGGVSWMALLGGYAIYTLCLYSVVKEDTFAAIAGDPKKD